ncbi:alternate-type signal peptide domain-containing protein [Georgenia muralis]|uniref:Alternate signal-mediated exported protein n=1 Tax=Georgenia muralis TaxID=154117 RepID=A0A3N4YZ18_9MICO|nr:alternate-type signal peptide domain-containing protein [Georgenia muralis]RPF26409.1 alternate signal-mediated exported protein [Georgenia muralis]
MSAPHTRTRTRTRKAVLAGVAGIALLAAGGGSFATWSDSEDLGGATITSGYLRIDGSSVVWTAGGKEIALDDYLVIPGSVLTYTATVDVDLAGDGLEAELATTLPTAVTAATAAKEADVALAGGLTVDVQVNGQDGTTITDSGEYTVVATITFPTVDDEGAAWGQRAQDAAAELADFQITLEQQIA